MEGNRGRAELPRPVLDTFVRQRWEAHGPVALELTRLAGGLESKCVARVTARFHDAKGRRAVRTFVAKRLEGPTVREALVYEGVVSRVAQAAAPRVLATEWMGEASCLLLLEAVRPRCRWPWRDVERSADVLARLAALHARAPLSAPAWDYDAELARSGTALVELMDRIPRDDALARVRAARPAVRRLVEALPAVRRQLLDAGPSSAALIHGDVHPGNVLVCARGGSLEPLLLDWARARVGSIYEDVSSWLHSLALWEPAAVQKHDTLLSRYLVAAGSSGRIHRTVRDAMWLASACTVLGGAAAHHIREALRAEGPARASAIRAAAHCTRILRRADACWRA